MSTDAVQGQLTDKVIKIRRCAAVVKGGRRFSFTALVVVGDGQGRVGWGYGKANEVPPAVEKAIKDGSRNMVAIAMERSSIPLANNCRRLADPKQILRLRIRRPHSRSSENTINGTRPGWLKKSAAAPRKRFSKWRIRY